MKTHTRTHQRRVVAAAGAVTHTIYGSVSKIDGKSTPLTLATPNKTYKMKTHNEVQVENGETNPKTSWNFERDWNGKSGGDGCATAIIVVIAEEENKQMRVMIVSLDTFRLLTIFWNCCCFGRDEQKKDEDVVAQISTVNSTPLVRTAWSLNPSAAVSPTRDMLRLHMHALDMSLSTTSRASIFGRFWRDRDAQGFCDCAQVSFRVSSPSWVSWVHQKFSLSGAAPKCSDRMSGSLAAVARHCMQTECEKRLKSAVSSVAVVPICSSSNSLSIATAASSLC